MSPNAVPVTPQAQSPVTRWAIWGLMFASAALASAAPRMSMAVLFAEIARDLDLSLVQVGLIWAAEVLTGIIASVLGGSLSDRYGARASLVVGCVMAGVFSAARGWAPDFTGMLLLSLLAGPFAALIPINLHKAGAQVFPRHQLAIANGGVSVGMAFGFTVGAFTAATYLSPALGGWRNVLILTGSVALMMGLVWMAVPRRTGVASVNAAATGMGMRESILHVWGIRDVRVICLAVFGYGSCVEGLLGYLPLYLRETGWIESRADLAVSVFHLASMAATIPVALWSDRLGNRRLFLVLGSSLLALATLSVPLLPGQSIFAAMFIGGLLRDAFMGIFITRLMESKGVGPAYAGGALGLAMMTMRLGGTQAPPLGNSLVAFGAGMPFYFWALFCILPIVFFLRLRDPKPEP